MTTELGYMKSLPVGGFNYDNCLRNNALEAAAKPGQVNKDRFMKTGTTICGLIFNVSVNLFQILRTSIGWSCPSR